MSITKRMRRITVYVVALMATVAALTACSGSSPAGPTTIELALVASGATPAGYQAQVDRFNKSQTNIVLKLKTYPSGDAYNQAILGQAGAGVAPDILSLDSGTQTTQFANAKAILPLDDLTHGAGIDAAGYSENILAASKVGGKLYAVPRDYSTTALFYRKSIFAAANLTPPTTWDQLVADAKQLTSGGIYGIGIDAKINYLLAWVAAAGGNFVTASGVTNINNPGHLVALNRVAKLFQADKSAATPAMTGASWDGDMLGKKQVAMVFGGTWIPGSLDKSVQSDIGVVALPTDAQSGSVLYAAGWAIAAASKHPDAAAKVIAFLSSDSELTQGHTDGIIQMPAKTSALDKLVTAGTDPVLTAAQGAAKYGTPFGYLTSAQVDAYNKILANLASPTSTLSAQDALGQIDSAVTSAK